jgi:deazaflavin-dependent oxidoreductase (nitroreductase family)
MGLAADLGYAYPRPNAFQRLVQAFAASRLGARLTPRTLVPLDRLSTRLTGGKVSLPLVLAGLPVLDLVTVGRKSGLPRPAHVIAVPFHDTLALLGTNFGQPNTPAWVVNLEHHPQVTVAHAGAAREVIARPATSDERSAVMRSAGAVFGGTTKYEQRLHGRREVRIFVLDPPAQEK